MEVWEKVFLGDAEYLQSTHGKLTCTICHRGDSEADDKAAAHEGIIKDPSENPSPACICHKDIVEKQDTSIHYTVAAMKAALEKRGADVSDGSAISTAFDNHCASCHATCGQCHVSRANAAGGGLVSDHEFKKTPSMSNQCNACHGARVVDEYLGNNEGVPGDIHWTKYGMTCNDCHGDELHGTGVAVESRFENPEAPDCTDCHQEVVSGTSGNVQHTQHLGQLSCQVCHSVEYKNCYNCHVGLNDEGVPFFTTEPSSMEFKIGLNPDVSDSVPYKYVVRRHPPLSPDVFEDYGENLLPGFDDVPTWKYATPHNVQLSTPQNAGCDSCHGNADLFLTEDDVAQGEKEANREVIVPKVPGK